MARKKGKIQRHRSVKMGRAEILKSVPTESLCSTLVRIDEVPNYQDNVQAYSTPSWIYLRLLIRKLFPIAFFNWITY